MAELLAPDLFVDPADAAFMAGQLDGLTTEQIRLKISEWAELKRYLPPELTAKPGKWKNDFTPYLVEPMDCLGPTSPARKVAIMKGAQIGATTGLLEMFIGYTVDHDPAGMIYISADKELTKMGMELKIDRMLFHSDLQHLLQSADGSKKKSGDTAVMKQFPNGFLAAFGAQNPGKLRSTSAKKMALDELDGMPLILGGKGQEEGNPITISEKRTDNYEATRKILYISTPLILQTSLINPLFLAGDQRHFYVPCVHCDFYQVLIWHGITEGGDPFGFTWDLDDNGTLVPDSVGYICENCAAIFYNHDKSNFLKRGEWRPHSKTTEEGLVSFHIPSFLSPVGMYPWKSIVYKWLKAWDVTHDRMLDRENYQAFRNLEEGKPWEERGESPKAEKVMEHRRAIYSEGEIPNFASIVETGAPVVLLTMALDVHKNRIDLEVVGWCQGRQTYSILWEGVEGDPDDTTPDGPWQRVRELLEKVWAADDGRQYRIQVTVIDVNFAEKADAVYEFCREWSRGVYPVIGREMPIKGALVKEFHPGQSAGGHLFYNVTASMYKDKLSGWLKPSWYGDGLQPQGYPNYPQDRRDDFFKQYEAEHKIAIVDPITKQRRGYRWAQIGQRANHAWDCRVYAMAAFDMIVFEVCLEVLKMEVSSYDEFFNYATPKKNQDGLWLPAAFSFHPAQTGGR